jgi:putative endonuclease
LAEQYYVYILTNQFHTVLYAGITNNLKQRTYTHKEGLGGRFTNKYKLVKLVYYEITNDVKAAISREKQIKAGSRNKKIDLVNAKNPEWKDLYDEL